jgi:ATP-dependent Lon protease
MGNELPTLSTTLTPFPLLPLRDVVVFPHMVIPLFVGRPKAAPSSTAFIDSSLSLAPVSGSSRAVAR